jgi:ACS family tartrate transporter-like MFS transporter
MTLREALTDARVVWLSAVYLAIVSASYGVTFFLPLMVKSHGLSNVATGLVTAIPYSVGTAGMIAWAYSSDRSGERRWHFIVASLVAAAGLLLAGSPVRPPVALAAMSLAAVGIYGSKPAFWPLPSTFLTGKAAAGGIALVNSIGNLGGFLGPYVVGWLDDRTHSYTGGLVFLAACAALSAVLMGTGVAKRPLSP